MGKIRKSNRGLQVFNLNDRELKQEDSEAKI